MTREELKMVAVKKTINILEECGIKYRKNDFSNEESKLLNGRYYSTNCIITLSGNVTLRVCFDDGKRGKKLKSIKNNFYNYYNCRVMEQYIQFTYTKKELELESVKQQDIDSEKMEKIMEKIQKLLALSESDNEHEAISASLMAQKLLAKYNIEIENVSGIKDDEQEIEEIKADVGTGNKWKYQLAGIIAKNYRCKHYYSGSDIMVFRGYRTDIMIARRVYVYLFQVCRRLGRAYEKKEREKYGYADGIYNSFSAGFCLGVDVELSKQCTELMLIIPQKVQEEFKTFASSFGEKDTTIIAEDYDAFNEGKTEGKRALNAQYLDDKAEYIE